MSIFFIGSEPEIFEGFSGGATTDALVTISGVNRAGCILDGPQAGIGTFSSALTEGWMHFICGRLSTSGSQVGVNNCFQLRNAEGQAVLTLTSRGSELFFRASVLGGAEVIIANGSRIDIQWKIAASGGYLRLWANEVNAINFSGDTRFASGTQSVSNFRIQGVQNTINFQTVWSQFLVSDLPTLLSKVYTRACTATTPNNWSGTPTDVTGTSLAGTTLAIKETTPEDKIRFDAADLPALTGDEFIGGVGFTASALAEVGTAVPRLAATLFNGTSEIAIGSTLTKTASFTPSNFLASTNPHTGGAWSVSAFNAMQFTLVAKA